MEHCSPIILPRVDRSESLTVTGANTLVNGEILANKVVISKAVTVKKPKKVSRDDDDDGGHSVISFRHQLSHR